MSLDIGKQIKSLRLEKGVTQEELANNLGVSYQAVSKWENEVTAPDIQLLPTISVYFGVTIDELFEIPYESKLRRIDNMLENERFITDEKFNNAEDFLLAIIKDDINNHRAYSLLAELYNHRANGFKVIASKYAKKALAICPHEKGYHNILVKSEGGALGDFYCNKHDSLIEYYKEFVKTNNDSRICYVFFFDQLMADRRYEEAKEILEKMKTFEHHIENIAFEGDIQLGLGNVKEAIKLWNENVERNPENCWAYFIRAERLSNIGMYEEALEDYKKSMELQSNPPLVDGLMAMSRVYEIIGKYEEAIKCHDKKINILKDEYKILSGEPIDESIREIERLKRNI